MICRGCEREFAPIWASRRYCDSCRGNKKRAARNARGVCAVCAKNPPEPDRSQCFDCSKKGKAVLRLLRQQRKNEHLCEDCGERPRGEHVWLCPPCESKRHRRRLIRNHSFDARDFNRYELAIFCDWCGLPFNGSKRPHIDHDHRCCSGDKHCQFCTRGFLHYDCNQRILAAHELVEQECGFISPQLEDYRRRFPVPRVPYE